MHQHVASHCASPIWLTFSVRIPSKKQLSSLMTDPSRGLRCKFACNCTKAYHIGLVGRFEPKWLERLYGSLDLFKIQTAHLGQTHILAKELKPWTENHFCAPRV